MGDRLIVVVKLVLDEDIIHICASQAKSNESIKRQFREEMDDLIQEIPSRENIFLGEDLMGM